MEMPGLILSAFELMGIDFVFLYIVFHFAKLLFSPFNSFQNSFFILKYNSFLVLC
jgi:hypothetical protein